MTTRTPKLPPTSPAKVIACLVAADFSLIGLIFGIALPDPAVITVFIILTILFFFGVVFYAMRLPITRHDAIFSLWRIGWALASTLFWSVAVGLGIFAIGYAVAVAAPQAAPLLLYALAFVAIMLVTWSAAQAAVRRRRMLLIISHLEKAVNMGLPTPRMIEAAAQGEQGIMRRRLLALHDYLDRGESLDQALLRAVPEVPLSVTRAIAAGQRMNCLGHVLEVIMRRNRRDTASEVYRDTPGFYWAYPIIMIVVVSLIMITVIPKYEGIFRDFRLDLPQTTRFLLAFSRALTNEFSPIFMLLLLLCLVPLGRALTGLFPVFRTIAPFNGIVTDQLTWWTPLLGGFVRDRGMADLCDFVSAGVQAGYPLNDSLREAASAQPNAVMRYRSLAWADAVSRGQPMHEAARYARMPQLFTAMLATVRNDQSLLQVLGFLWRNYEFRFSRARAIAQSAFVPLIVLIFGSVVALIGCSLMQPIALLSRHIAEHISGGF